MNPIPAPVMNSLVSETKVICNDSIPNPITPVPVPVKVLPTTTDTVQSITILNGTHIKLNKDKHSDVCECKLMQQKEDLKEDITKDDNSMNTDSNELSNESSLSLSEPMDCNSTPNISPAHVAKSSSSNEDVAMSETVRQYLFL